MQTPAAQETRGNQKFWSLALLAIIVLSVVIIRIRLLEIPLERDEGEFAYSAHLLLKGIPPYLMAYTMKLPGITAMYALSMVLFGKTIAGIHLGLLVVNISSIIMVYFLARRLFDPVAGVVGGAAFAMLSLGMGVLGVSAHATNFVVAFALAGMILLLRYQDSGKVATLFISGLAFGFSFLMKQNGIFFAVFALLYLLWGERASFRGESQRLVRHGLAFAGATMAPFAACCLLLAVYGVFDNFWFWTFRYAREYVTRVPFDIGLIMFQDGFAEASHAALPLWIMAGMGLWLLFADKWPQKARFFVAGLLCFSFLAICPGFYFRNHYFVMLLPVIAILNGIATTSSAHLLSRLRHGHVYRFIPIFLFAAAVSYVAYQEREFFSCTDPAEVSRMLFEENPFPESLPIARYLRERSAPDDRITVLGSEPQIFFYADRLSATGHIYMYGLMENHRYAENMQQEMIREIEAAKPKFIVSVDVQASWLMNDGSSPLILEWGKRYLKEHYQLVGIADITLGGNTVYRWDEEVTGYMPRAKDFVYVYRRID